ncbi:hypothetical protein F5X68DRAFT_209035, partial [Plectosphaerella plurivora]
MGRKPWATQLGQRSSPVVFLAFTFPGVGCEDGLVLQQRTVRCAPVKVSKSKQARHAPCGTRTLDCRCRGRCVSPDFGCETCLLS